MYSTVNGFVMKISEFEKVTNLSRDTIRYYEKIGMLTPPLRGANGYREYGKVQQEEIAFIQKGKMIGFDLSSIKDGYQHYKEQGYFCPDFTKQLHRKRDELFRQINKNKESIAEIDHMLK